MIDRLDLLMVTTIIETQTIGGQSFRNNDTHVMPYMFICSNESFIITGVMSHVIRLKIFSISGTDITYVDSMYIDMTISISDFTNKLGNIINPPSP